MKLNFGKLGRHKRNKRKTKPFVAFVKSVSAINQKSPRYYTLIASRQDQDQQYKMISSALLLINATFHNFYWYITKEMKRT